MTKKDFQFIADVLWTHKPIGDDEDSALYRYYWLSLVEDFTESLAAANPQFDKERFLKASGYYD